MNCYIQFLLNFTQLKTGVATGGGDNTVKFWQLELVPDMVTHTKAKVLSLLHTRTLQLDEAVLCVRISPNSKLIAVALLDSTVKLFFLDTLKVSYWSFQSNFILFKIS